MNIKNFDPFDFKKKEINSVPVYYKNIPTASIINVRICINAGAFCDKKGKEGTAHFLEHLIFAGCPLFKDKKSIIEFRKKNTLNSLNAFTGFYNTCWTFATLPEKYKETLNGVKDMIFNSYLRKEDLETERKIITQEAWNRFQNEKYLNYIKELNKNIYRGSIRERFFSSLGWPETISKISQKDVKDFYNTYYGRENLFIILTGNIEKVHIDYIKTFLKNVPKGDKAKYSFGNIKAPIKKRFIKLADDIGEIKEQVEINISREANAINKNKNIISNLSNRLINDLLHERLRIENSLCYMVNVNGSKTKDFFSVNLNVKTEKDKIDLLESEIRKTLKEIIDGYHKERFENIKNIYLEQVESMEILSSNLATQVVSEITNLGKIENIKELLKSIKKATHKDIIDFIKCVFDEKYLFTEIILPSKKNEKQNAKKD